MKYLFAEWDAVKKRINSKYLFIFLDFDGTLVPIAGTPDKAVLRKRTKDLLRRMIAISRVKIAVISGRALGDIKKRVGLKAVVYSGNHGMEIEAGEVSFQPVITEGYIEVMRHIKRELKQKTFSVAGVFLEDKGFSLGLHYRLVDKKNIPLVKAVFYAAAMPFSLKKKIKIKTGKMVLEIMPPVKWDKGKAVLRLLATRAFAAPGKRAFPVYIGDDVTDEDAFKALKNKGLTVSVGRRKDSCAEYYLRGQDEVAGFLERIYKGLRCPN